MDYFELGQVLKPQGIRGEIKLRPYTDDLERFGALSHVFLKNGKNYEKRQVQSARVYKEFAFLKLEGVEDRNAAELLRSKRLYIDRENAAPLEEGACYIADLVGLRILDEQGKELGRIEEIMQIAGGVDVYRASGPKGGMMFPAAPGVILQKSPEEGKIVVDSGRLAEVVLYD